MYFTEKNITRFNNIGYTYFLNPNELNIVKSKMKKNEYSIYYPYKDSEKAIIYKKIIPDVLLYEIKCNQEIRHQDILGAMYSLNISPDLFGDILIIDNKYYIYILPIVRNYFESNLLNIRNNHVLLEELDINYLIDYEREYEILEIIVSSNRIDTVISSIIHTARSNINVLIKKKEILLNYDYLKNLDYKLKESDIFSIKRIGKYKYIGIINNTRGNHYIIKLLKYK